MSKKEAQVLIVEQDSYARNWMALLLARDWRTGILGEIATADEIVPFYQSRQSSHKHMPLPSLILLNADQTGAEDAIWEALGGLPGTPGVLLIREQINTAVMQKTPFPGFCGYLLKREIRSSLAWAIALADPAHWVITPAVENFYQAQAGHRPFAVLQGDNPIHNFSEHEADVARLALVFSMERGEMSDEIKVSREWVYGLVSSIYRKLGMEEILSGEVDAAEYLGLAFAQVPRVREVLQQASGSRKKTDLETLAFHILTMPTIRMSGQGG